MSKQIVTCITKKEFNSFYKQIMDYTKKNLSIEPATPKEFDDGLTVVSGYVGKHMRMSVEIETWRLK